METSVCEASHLDELLKRYTTPLKDALTPEEMKQFVALLEEHNPGLHMHGPDPYPQHLRPVFMRNALQGYFREVYAQVLLKREELPTNTESTLPQ